MLYSSVLVVCVDLILLYWVGVRISVKVQIAHVDHIQTCQCQHAPDLYFVLIHDKLQSICQDWNIVELGHYECSNQ